MKVFLSHSTLDREFAERLADAMREERFEPWLSEIDIKPGTNWVKGVDKGLRDADLVLLLWSPNAAKSIATEHEWTAAFDREITEKRLRLELVLLADCQRPELLRTRQYIDASQNQERGIGKVIQWLRERRDAGRAGGGRAPIYLPDFRSDEFVGRRNYVEKLRAALIDEPGLCLLSGEPGAGKSTIALMFALEAQRDFDAVVFQTCGQRKLDTIIGELADKLKIELGDAVVKAPPQEKLEAIKGWLKDRQSLLILDDIWLDSSSMTVSEFSDILPGTPVSILFTSRRATLPRLHAEDVIHVDAFSPEEAEEVFKNYLGARTIEQYREPLLEFAKRVERLPIAVTVGAEFLRNQFGPLGEAARSIALAHLKTEIQDVSGLLQRAIEAQSESAQRLLKAAAVCVPDGFWLPLAIEIAGLDKAAAQTARDHLVHASLLRVLDQERQRFQLHSLVREQACSVAAPLSDLQHTHAKALENLFKDWETRWKECRECLQEIIPASEFLWNSGEISRTSWLIYYGYVCGSRIGELDIALRFLQQEANFWKNREDREAKDALQRNYGNQAIILKAWGRLDEAMALHKKEEQICLELGNRDSLQRSYGNQAVILEVWGRLEEAMALHKKKEEICLELGNKMDLQISYGNQANILQAWGRLEEAMTLYKNKEEICLELGRKESLAYCYWNWGLLARKQGDHETEKQKLETALAIFTELKMPRERDKVKAELEKSQGQATGQDSTGN